VVRALIPGFAAELRAADSAVSTAEVPDGPDGETASSRSKARLKAARARLGQLEADLCPPSGALPGGSRLERERWALRCLGGERDLVHGVLRDRLKAELEHQLQQRRSQLHDRYRKWEDKYAVSLAATEAASAAASAKMWEALRGMGYAD
jgi:type I restriction enzyme M protein